MKMFIKGKKRDFVFFKLIFNLYMRSIYGLMNWKKIFKESLYKIF